MKCFAISISIFVVLLVGNARAQDSLFTTLPLSNMNWVYYYPASHSYVSPAPGVFEMVSEGLKIYGIGYRNGVYLHPTPFSQYPVINKTLYFKWKANGGGNFMGVWPMIFTDSISFTNPAYPQNLTTHHSFYGSYVITEDQWYYTRWVIDSTAYTCVTASGNYDNAGGTIIQSKTAELDNDYRCFGFGMVDCYASTAAYAILGDVRIESNLPLIQASAGPNGAIVPTGDVPINYGSDTTFTIIPNTGYHVTDVLVDSISIGPVLSYHFDNVTANHTIFSSFAIDTFTITASADSNGNISPSGNVIVNYGADTTFAFTPNVGYHVANVLVDDTTVGPVTSYHFSNIIANHTIAATFAIDTFVIQATADTNGMITPSGLITVRYESDTTFTIVPYTGYHVLDVLVDSVSIGPQESYHFENIIANHSISATFAINNYTITAVAEPNGMITPSGEVSVEYGGNQSFTIMPDTGYHVFNVLVDSVSMGPIAAYTFSNVTVNHSIYVTFAIDSFIITADAGTHGIVSPSGVININYGSDTTFTIIPDMGYHVLDVLVDGSLIGPVTSYTFTDVRANHSISASFAMDIFIIIASAGPNGSISPSGVVDVNYGTDTTFTITPNGNYQVDYVLVDGISVGSVGTYTFTDIDANHAITAIFAAMPLVCQYVVGDANGSGTWTGQDVTYGVRFFKGGNPPPFSCECTPGHTWYVSGDVNGSCSFTGQDVTRMVLHFKTGVPAIVCADCPPVARLIPPLTPSPLIEHGIKTAD